MQAIADFLSGIGDFLLGIGDFIVSFFTDIVFMIKMLGNIASVLPTYFSWLPSSVLSGLLLVFTLVILYKIIGREG